MNSPRRYRAKRIVNRPSVPAIVIISAWFRHMPPDDRADLLNVIRSLEEIKHGGPVRMILVVRKRTKDTNP